MLTVKNWKKLHQKSETSLISLSELHSSESISPSSLACALVYGIDISFNAYMYIKNSFTHMYIKVLI